MRASVAILASVLACAPKPVRQGMPLPAVEVRALDGAPVRLDELRGQVVVLDVWATWCEPCKKTLPEYAGLAGPVRVLAMSVDEDDAPVREFAKQLGSITVLRDPGGAVAEQLGVTAMPTTFVLGRDGAVKLRVDGVPRDDEVRRTARALAAER